ncbi:MAG: amidase [Acidobacteriota bacterium]|jgi:Asp-tRNA(Asn)/Glu-tRNA(Gln) amidotransferase A subunit family amidase|nr:amidase [Acidobacteriota bacterium]
MSDELVKLSAIKLAALMRARRVSPVEVVEAHLRRIERLNPQLNAIVTLNPDALEQAREAEAAMMRGEEVGLLHGVPLTIKDTIETKGLKTTSGSMLRAQHIPDEDAPAVARLKDAGAILLGKTNVPEMAIPYECDNPIFGRTNNPHDLSLTAGGSSGGEAAAISACLSSAGLGSDLSGSIRVPAHFCGIVGLKPTPGRVSSAGHFPPASGLLSEGAVIGPMARRIEDLSLLLNVLTESSVATFVSAQEERASERMRGWRVASYIDESHAPVKDETRDAIDAALQALNEAGLLIVEEKPPGLERAMELWNALFSRVSASQLREVYAGHEEQAGAIVRAVLASAEHSPLLPPDEFARVWAERNALRAALVTWMQTTPLIIAPVGAVSAFEHGARRVEVEGNMMSVFRAFSYSRAFNVLGLPALSLPAGCTHDCLPIGVQIIGRPFQEEAVLAAASIIEESLGGWVEPPNTIMG